MPCRPRSSGTARRRPRRGSYPRTTSGNETPPTRASRVETEQELVSANTGVDSGATIGVWVRRRGECDNNHVLSDRQENVCDVPGGTPRTSAGGANRVAVKREEEYRTPSCPRNVTRGGREGPGVGDEPGRETRVVGPLSVRRRV